MIVNKLQLDLVVFIGYGTINHSSLQTKKLNWTIIVSFKKQLSKLGIKNCSFVPPYSWHVCNIILVKAEPV